MKSFLHRDDVRRGLRLTCIARLFEPVFGPQVALYITGRASALKLTVACSIALTAAPEGVDLVISIHLNEIKSMVANPGAAFCISAFVDPNFLHVPLPFDDDTRQVFDSELLAYWPESTNLLCDRGRMVAKVGEGT